ncbi:MAG: sigma-54 dependent transcriptional regulator [Pirellulales bacterium]|nr:sigma-54 dependent transcriptional regulator [Pirellulales bacterium]
MQASASLIDAVWREACRHIQIDEALELIAPLVAAVLPHRALVLRRVDRERLVVETVAAAGYDAPALLENARDEISETAAASLLTSCAQRRVVRVTPLPSADPVAGLVPNGVRGPCLVATWQLSDGSPGGLVVIGDVDEEFGPQHQRTVEALVEPLAVALENDRRVRELNALRLAAEADRQSLLTRLGRNDITDSVIGAETGLREVMQRVELVARTEVPILILGETGSGKEVVAREIHNRSRRAAGPFVRVNCGAIPPELVDSELFGHERGSFTGATTLRKGWFERADGGTLLLDECGELPLGVQVRLLRILQDGAFERVGGEQQLHVDVRIVAATHRDLQRMVLQGAFREDLWYRLAVFPVNLPPLRERRVDIPAMATHFAARAAKRLGLPACVPSAQDVVRLQSYPWPGNVRELAAVIERAAILGEGRFLDIQTSLGQVPSPNSAEPVGETGLPQAQRRPLAEPRPSTRAEFLSLDAAMRQHIEAALARTRGRIEGPQGAAALLAINPHTLRARMRKLKIAWQAFREQDNVG